MKYMPIFRFRDSEKKALESVAYSTKIMPLIEIVQEKRRGNMNLDCFDEIKSYIQSTGNRLFIDFPLYIKLKPNTAPNVANFLRPILANPSLRLSYFNHFVGENIIPVVSYNPHTPLFQQNFISNEIMQLRNSFDQIAIRISLNHAQLALNEASPYLIPNDIIILDLDTTSHTDSSLIPFYQYIIAYAQQHRCQTVLVRAAISPDTTNTGLTNNQIISTLDNTLLTNYSNYGFDAFGDYCGIKKDELTEGGQISPGCIFYHWWDNSYYGHKGTYKQASTFTSMVVPSIMSSIPWNNYQIRSMNAHEHSCPGCRMISTIARGTEAGNSAPKWKIIVSSHYLYTMEEFL